jgi:hypothetical protein
MSPRVFNFASAGNSYDIHVDKHGKGFMVGKRNDGGSQRKQWTHYGSIAGVENSTSVAIPVDVVVGLVADKIRMKKAGN